MNFHFSIFSFLDISTFVCPTEIIAFSDRIQEFQNINTESTLTYFLSLRKE
jgi:alkyl hydroperoxide reductase subunit AhpC